MTTDIMQTLGLPTSADCFRLFMQLPRDGRTLANLKPLLIQRYGAKTPPNRVLNTWWAVGRWTERAAKYDAEEERAIADTEVVRVQDQERMLEHLEHLGAVAKASRGIVARINIMLEGGVENPNFDPNEPESDENERWLVAPLRIKGTAHELATLAKVAVALGQHHRELTGEAGLPTGDDIATTLDDDELADRIADVRERKRQRALARAGEQARDVTPPPAGQNANGSHPTGNDMTPTPKSP